MFNNRFNSTKKDPLVEAVQIAMQDGEIRRQAEALVNEAFGVYNRNAVVREELAAYDAAIEEAYKCMKEEDKKDEKPKSGYSKEKDKHKAAYSKMREKMVGKGKDYETTSKIVSGMKEGLTVEPVQQVKNTNSSPNPTSSDISNPSSQTQSRARMGATPAVQEGKKLADKDYDKDGKVESPKDEVWGSRFRAAKMAGKMEEEQIDEISHKLALKAMKKSDERGEEEYDRDMTDDRLSDPKTHWDRAKRLRGHMKRKFGNKTIKTGGTDNLSPKSYEQGGGERRRADKLKKGPRAGMISARHRDKLKDNIKYSLGKHKKPNLPEEAQIAELTKPTAKTAHKVLNRSEDDLDKSAKAANRLYSWKMKRYPGKTKKYSGTAELPGAGNVEMHQDKYPGYVTKAGKLTKSATKDTKREIKDRLGKHAKPHLPEGYELDEAAYSAKAARAGKDIGKPGKEFKKIAKSAAARYGSEERGKKVAGAILKRIRAKHMREADMSSGTDVTSALPKNPKNWENTPEVTMNAAREARKSLEGSKGEIRNPKDNPSKYPGL